MNLGGDSRDTLLAQCHNPDYRQGHGDLKCSLSSQKLKLKMKSVKRAVRRYKSKIRELAAERKNDEDVEVSYGHLDFRSRAVVQ